MFSQVSTAGTWQCDLADSALQWSTAVYDLFGIPVGARLNRAEVVKLYTPESREMLEALRARAIERAESFTFEAQIRRPDGALRWMRITADIVCTNGHPTQLYGLKQDVTDEWTRQ